jgi:hypothetical protein
MSIVQPQAQAQQTSLSSMLPEGVNTEAITTGVTGAVQGVKDTLGQATANVQQTLNEFSSTSVVDASREYLDSNSLIAKFGFIILVLFGFLFLFRVGMLILSAIFAPSTSPYLVKGMISGNEPVKVQQDPKVSSAIVNLSENESSGIEFTYSVWLNFSGVQGTNGKEYHIFNKGVDASSNSSNAPGLYVISKSDGTNTLKVYMDTFKTVGAISGYDSQRESVEIEGIPMNKWINVMIRMQNKVLDVYVNGVLTKHKDLQYVPRQNFGDVYVCQKGGFAGKLSNLRYYSSALNVFEINGVVAWGPDLSTSESTSASNSKDTSYISYLWYKANR